MPNYPIGCGATRPCAKCGMSEKNTVHRSRTQYGYHIYEPRPVKEESEHNDYRIGDEGV